MFPLHYNGYNFFQRLSYYFLIKEFNFLSIFYLYLVLIQFVQFILFFTFNLISFNKTKILKKKITLNKLDQNRNQSLTYKSNDINLIQNITIYDTFLYVYYVMHFFVYYAMQFLVLKSFLQQTYIEIKFPEQTWSIFISASRSMCKVRIRFCRQSKLKVILCLL